MASFGDARRAAFGAAAARDHFLASYAGLTAFQRHQRLLQQLATYGGDGGGDGGDAGGDAASAALAGTRTDADVLREVRCGVPLSASLHHLPAPSRIHASPCSSVQSCLYRQLHTSRHTNITVISLHPAPRGRLSQHLAVQTRKVVSQIHTTHMLGTTHNRTQSYRFIRRPEDDAANTWEARLAQRYYSRLFKEYAIADLSR